MVLKRKLPTQSGGDKPAATPAPSDALESEGMDTGMTPDWLKKEGQAKGGRQPGGEDLAPDLDFNVEEVPDFLATNKDDETPAQASPTPQAPTSEPEPTAQDPALPEVAGPVLPEVTPTPPPPAPAEDEPAAPPAPTEEPPAVQKEPREPEQADTPPDPKGSGRKRPGPGMAAKAPPAQLPGQDEPPAQKSGGGYAPPPSFAEEDVAAGEADTGLPWAATQPEDESGADWDIEDLLKDLPEDDAAAPAGPGDVYADLPDPATGGDGAGGRPGTPPWQSGGADPAILPEDSPGRNTTARRLAGAVLVGVVVYGVYMFLTQSDTTAEFLARWTGTLREVSEELPEEPGQMARQGDTGAMAPEDVVELDDTDIFTVEQPDTGGLPPAADGGMGGAEGQAASGEQTAQADGDAGEDDVKVEFIDVPEDEAGEPIVGEGEDMPEDVSLFASVQRAIAEARKKRDAENGATTVDEKIDQAEQEALASLPPAELQRRNTELTQKLEEELAAYRRALAEGAKGPVKPKPGEFFSNPEAYDPNRAPGTIDTSGRDAIPGTGGRQGAERGLTPGESYQANPNNLPYMPEPEIPEEEPTIRTLSDFDVSMFAPKEQRVRIPKNIRPRMNAADFPGIHLLSLVPGRGVIAHANGREGALLIGETIEGWELVAVQESYAEFSNGKRRHVVSMEGDLSATGAGRGGGEQLR